MFGKKLGYEGGMRRILQALALTLIPLTGWAQEAAEKQATFRSGVDLVTVSATVRDNKGRLVKDLTQKDFEVIDRGERRSISEFRSERAPMSVAILFDVSGSMDTADRATAAKFAAHHLLNQLQEGRDEAGLFAFDSRLREVAPFSVDTRALKGALGEVDPFGATSLHDAVAAAADRVATRPFPRRAVVVLTGHADVETAVEAMRLRVAALRGADPRDTPLERHARGPELVPWRLCVGRARFTDVLRAEWESGGNELFGRLH